MSADLKIGIASIFYSIQGEGVYAGAPATFIRTQGCSVHCSFCDEKPTWSPSRPKVGFLSLDDIVKEILGYPNDLIVITGGEPLECRDLPALVHALRSQFPRAKIQLETSGQPVELLAEHAYLFDSVCVSPKILHTSLEANPLGHRIYENPQFIRTVSGLARAPVFFKVVVNDFNELSFFVEALRACYHPRFADMVPLLYVNPIDPGYDGNRDYAERAISGAAITMVSKLLESNHSWERIFPSLRVGLQLHKIYALK